MKILFVQTLLSLLLSVTALSQSLETPVFDFDRKQDNHYIDSLITNTKNRIAALRNFAKSEYTDTVKMELLHYIGYVYRSGNYRADSTLHIANELIQMATQKANIKYQIKGLLLLEHYNRINVRNYAEAMQNNYQLIRLLEKSPEEKKRNEWRVYNNLGILLYRMEKFRESVTYLQKAIENFHFDTKANPIHLTTIYQSLGEAYRMDFEYQEALQCYKKALKILQEYPNLSTVSNFAYVYGDIAGAHRHLKNYPEALLNYTLSENYWIKLKNKTGLALTWTAMADTYFHLQDYDKAIEFSKKGIQNANNLSSTFVQGYEVLFNSFELKEDYQQALKYHRLLVNKTDSVRKSKNIAEMMAVKANYEKETLEFKLLQDKKLQEERIIMLQQKEESERARNEIEKQNLLKTIENNDLLKQLQIQTITTESQKRQTTAQNTIKQLKINELKQKIKTDKQTQKILFISLILICLCGALLIWYNFKLRAKNKLLKSKNAEIEEALLRGQTIERKRVATELHDSVSSILASVKVSLQAHLPQTSKDIAVYGNAIKMVEDATREVRKISHNLMPYEIEQEGLENSLKTLVIRYNLSEKILFSLNINADLSGLDSNVAYNIYAICSELCQNILKHSEATTANIDIEENKNKLIVFISDNGIGFDPKKTNEGMGLKNVFHRARTINSQLKLQSASGEGSTYYLIINI